MANEDFTTTTGVDPNSHMTTTAAKIDFAGLARNEDAYRYWDKGVAHFAGDFEHLAEIKMTSRSGYVVSNFISLTNIIDDWYGIQVGGGDHISFFWSNISDLRLRETIAGTWYQSLAYTGSLGTIYYIKFKRDESVGTYGTLYLYIYSDAARTNLLQTLSLALHEKEDFRYIYPVQTYNDADASNATGYIKDLDLQEAAAGVVIPVFMAQYRQRWA